MLKFNALGMVLSSVGIVIVSGIDLITYQKILYYVSSRCQVYHVLISV